MAQQGPFPPAAAMDPTTFLIGSGMQALGGAIAGAPSTAVSAADAWGMFDSSGWTVATGGSKADGAIVGPKSGGEKYGAGMAGALGGLSGGLSGLLPWLIVGAVGVAMVRAWRK